MEIRRALPQDAAGIFACAVAAFSDYIMLISRTPAPMMEDYYEGILSHHCFLAEDERGLLGFILLKEDERESGLMWLEVLACDPQYQGDGTGTALLSLAEAHMRALRKTECRLYSHVKYTRAHTLYQRFDYETYARVQEQGYDRYYMKKSLKKNVEGAQLWQP